MVKLPTLGTHARLVSVDWYVDEIGVDGHHRFGDDGALVAVTVKNFRPGSRTCQKLILQSNE